jgi:hypothetical protein
MSLFHFLNWLTDSKPKPQIAAHRIWLTKRAKFAGIQREIAAALADPNGPDAVFLVANFQDSLDELRALAAEAQFDENRVFVIDSKSLEGRTSGSAADESQSVFIVVGDRHPLPSHDDALLEFAQNLSCRCRFVQHAALEDPLLKVFAGEWVEDVLRRLGMNEDEPIESHMVSRRIRRAQQQFAAQATGDAAAASAEEWIEKNCPAK